MTRTNRGSLIASQSSEDARSSTVPHIGNRTKLEGLLFGSSIKINETACRNSSANEASAPGSVVILSDVVVRERH